MCVYFIVHVWIVEKRGICKMKTHYFPEKRLTWEPEFHYGFILEFLHDDEIIYIPDDGKREVSSHIRRKLKRVSYGQLARLMTAANDIHTTQPWQKFEDRREAFIWAMYEKDIANKPAEDK